jgi:hypothetical protein
LVETENNPYAPPKSDILIVPEEQGPEKRKVFSPAQASLGALFGGPFAATYYVAMNFQSLQDRRGARLTIFSGIIISVVTILGHYLLSYKLVGYGISLIYPIIVWLTISQLQFTQSQISASKSLTLYSNTRVAGVALLGGVTIMPFGAAVSYLLSLCGIMPLP